MKTKIAFSVLFLGMALCLNAQKPSISLTFTADFNGQHVPLSSIFIENLTQGGDTTLFAPDTVLLIDYDLGIADGKTIISKGFILSQNYPNPIRGKTTVGLYLRESAEVVITVSDIIGRELFTHPYRLLDGNHLFTFHAGPETIYFLTVQVNYQSRTIKMFNHPSLSSQSGHCRLEYAGRNGNPDGYKSGSIAGGFVFVPGDQLQFTAYTDQGVRTIVDAPEADTTYIFQYAGGVPCPGLPEITYEGQVYTTVLIGSQCWLKENLNVGVMIEGHLNQSDDGIIEKYCYHNNPVHCDNFGGLYQWNEMMGYSTAAGAKGICPEGWHIPTDDEWKVLEGAVDSLYGVGHAVWNNAGFRGHDAGKNLKSETVWNAGVTGVDLYGFTALPGGYRFDVTSPFVNMYGHGFWWSSNEKGQLESWSRNLWHASGQSNRFDYNKMYGFSVRCLRDD